jgi:hypothetical protein
LGIDRLPKLMYVFLPLRTMKPSPYEVRKTREINGFIRGQNIPRVKKKYTGNAETWRQAVDTEPSRCRRSETVRHSSPAHGAMRTRRSGPENHKSAKQSEENEHYLPILDIVDPAVKEGTHEGTAQECGK